MFIYEKNNLHFNAYLTYNDTAYNICTHWVFTFRKMRGLGPI